MMVRTLVFAAMTVALAAPVAAEKYVRDSDGDVTSVVTIRPYPVRDYVEYRFDDADLEFAVTSTGGGISGGNDVVAPGSQVRAGGQTFRVEQSGNQVYLRNLATGARIAGTPIARQAAAQGRRVNPQSFGID